MCGGGTRGACSPSRHFTVQLFRRLAKRLASSSGRGAPQPAVRIQAVRHGLSPLSCVCTRIREDQFVLRNLERRVAKLRYVRTILRKSRVTSRANQLCVAIEGHDVLGRLCALGTHLDGSSHEAVCSLLKGPSYEWALRTFSNGTRHLQHLLIKVVSHEVIDAMNLPRVHHSPVTERLIRSVLATSSPEGLQREMRRFSASLLFNLVSDSILDDCAHVAARTVVGKQRKAAVAHLDCAGYETPGPASHARLLWPKKARTWQCLSKNGHQYDHHGRKTPPEIGEPSGAGPSVSPSRDEQTCPRGKGA